MPKTGHFILHSNVLPEITAGHYQLVSEHTGLPFGVAPETTHVHVAAPRFTMPVDQILSTFPPANAEGAFGDRLPQVVLKRRTLPWERNPAGATEPSPTPWLALVVVAEGEAELSTATPVAQCVTPGTALLDPDDKDVEQGLYLNVTETVVRKVFPTEAELPLLVHVREVDVNDTELAGGDDDGWLAVVLANRLPVFDAAQSRPVRYMACLINVEGQLAALPKPAVIADHFAFALAQDWSVLATLGSGGGADPLVMGGLDASHVVLPAAAGLAPGTPRADTATGSGAPTASAAFPAFSAAGPAATAVGGALDGGQALRQPPVANQWRQTTKQVAAAARDPDAQRLVRDTMGLGFRYPIGRYAREKVLRFPLLAHWSFTTNEGATFEKLMKNLDVGLLGTLPPPPTPVPGKPEPAPVPASGPEVVATGHVGLGHRARRGDAMQAWYRGPGVPFPTSRNGTSGNAPLPLAHAADQLRRVVPDGREDLSLAAAFEIGRLLALSQLSVVSALLRFRAEQFGAGRVRELLATLVPFDLPKILATDGPARVDLGRFVAVQVVDALARDPELLLGPRRPVVDPGRALPVEGDLDRLIAAGLGLDHDALVKRSARVGVLAALQGTAVPVVGAMGDGGGDKGHVALREALNAELMRTLQVATPVVRLRPGVARAAAARAAAAPGPDASDALDALIEHAPADDLPDEEGQP